MIKLLDKKKFGDKNQSLEILKTKIIIINDKKFKDKKYNLL